MRARCYRGSYRNKRNLHAKSSPPSCSELASSSAVADAPLVACTGRPRHGALVAGPPCAGSVEVGWEVWRVCASPYTPVISVAARTPWAPPCTPTAPPPMKHRDIGFGVAPGGPAVGPPGLAGVPGAGVDPAGRSVGLLSATPVPHTALTGGPQNRPIIHPKPGFTEPSCRHRHVPFGTGALIAHAMRIPRSDTLDERVFGRRNRCKSPYVALLGSTLLASPLSTMMRRTW